MATYSINYDLSKPGRNYNALYEEIKSLGAWWHYLESTWIVRTSLNATQIANRLKTHLDSNDKLAVIRTGSEWATVGIDQNGVDWLRKAA